MSLILTLPAPKGVTVAETVETVLKLPPSDFQRIPQENPLNPGVPLRPQERPVVIQIGVAFLVLLWLATRKRTF